MPKNLGQILRVLCLGLAVALVGEVVVMILHLNPLGQMATPTPPRWQSSDDAPPVTNQVAKLTPPPSTNSASTHSVSTSLPSTAIVGTNVTRTNLTGIGGLTTNVLGTNFVGTNSLETNLIAIQVGGTNLVQTHMPSVSSAPSTMPPPMGMSMGMGMPMGGPPFMRGAGGGRPPRPLSALIQARIDRITQSELLAPIIRPPPMALLGIAGRDAFIRTPSGQSTLLREGGESDGIKLLRLGTNRVLIEQAGEKKELTIFSGFGSESLLPKK